MPSVATHSDAIRAKISAVEVRHMHAVGTVPGVVVLQVAASNGPGQGTLSCVGGMLTWKAPGSSVPGLSVDVSAGGEFLIEDGENAAKWLRVQSYADWLSTTAIGASVQLVDRYDNGPPGDDVPAAEAAAGAVEAWTVDLVNESDRPVAGLVAWLDPSMTRLAISADGVAWSDATDETTAVALGGLAPSAATTIHIQRTITAGESFDPRILTWLHLAWDSF